MRHKRSRVLSAWLALLALALVLITTNLRLSTDMSLFLPRSSDPLHQLVLNELRDGASARLLMLAIDGEDPQRLAALSRALSANLTTAGRFARVVNGENGLDEAEQARWFPYRYLLDSGPLDFSESTLRQALQQRLQELNSPLGAFTTQTLAADPTAAFRQFLRQWQGERSPRVQHGVWFADDGRALLFAESQAGGFDLDAQQHNIEQIHAAFASLDERGEAQLFVSGAAAIAVASRETIRNESQWLSLVASVAVLLILLLAYRSPRLWLLSTLPLLSGFIVALAITSVLFGTVHGITLAFGITLLGVAIDYPIHLFSHLQPGCTPQQTLARIWPTLRLGVVSTAAGYLAMIATPFDGLVQLGVFTISGLLTAAAVTRWVVPIGLPPQWAGATFTFPVPSGEGRFLLLARLLPLLLFGSSVLLLVQSDQPLWEQDVAALSPVPEHLRQQDRTLREALSVADMNQMLLIEAVDAETVLQQSEALREPLERLRREGAIEGYQMAAQWLPSIARQQARQQQLPEEQALRQALTAAQEGLPFREEAFVPFIEQINHSRQLTPLTPADLDTTLFATRIAPLLFERDGRWWALLRLSGVQGTTSLANWSEQQRIPGLHFLDLKAGTNDLINGFRDAALQNLWWGALLIAALLWWGLRQIRRVLVVLLPVATALAVTIALLHLLGERLSLFHLTALLLVLGIGIDYSLFFSRRDLAADRRRTGHALLVCAISTLTVFGILAFSRLPVLHAIGLTVFLGVSASYGFAWLSAVAAQPDLG